MALTFLAPSLTPAERGVLRAAGLRAQPAWPPAPSTRLWVDGHAVGWLEAPQQAQWLSVAPLPPHDSKGWHWHTGAPQCGWRSRHMQRLAQRLAAVGAIAGWRNEWQDVPALQSAAGSETDAPVVAWLERAAFRFFGLRSRAVHINACDASGRWWCGRRAANKSRDPGLLDNLAAGGVAAGESLKQCALRELWEEAGVPLGAPLALQGCGVLHSRAWTVEGWHNELLHCAVMALPPGFVPHNQDGEVAAFESYTPAEVVAAIDAGLFTVDAAAAFAQTWLGSEG
ncbi:NUDIX domain-containing protein [Roseateles sp. BYS180W]|uniref:NUDIX domain-containing protein n=1 Tax=Roseateles rivi TaxID=3299028 RepID=A0ABW7FXU1_9BURK